MKKQFLYLLLPFFLTGNIAIAQSYLMQNGSISTCGGNFFDSGDSNTFYGANQNLIYTICPDQVGQKISILFTQFDLHSSDSLCVYAGNSTAAPLIDCYSSADLLNQATNETFSCLTFQFISDGSFESDGWKGEIQCIQSCQDFEPVATTIPALDTAFYVGVCQGDSITFNGTGNYTNNDNGYHQSDATSSFQWYFGNGNGSTNQSDVQVYNNPGLYPVSLGITDANNCTEQKFVAYIKVSGPPTFIQHEAVSDSICIFDTLALYGQVLPQTYGVNFEMGGDSIWLPDDLGIPFESEIGFNVFPAGDTITSGSDIQQICAVMEHSWMHDIEIKIECPNGSQVILHDHPGNNTPGGVCFLGIPIDGPPGPGTGWEYCWDMNSTNGTFIQYNAANSPGTLPSGDYNPYESFDNLIGCPLNGDWKIIVEDLWGGDDGYIFNWSIKFDSSLFDFDVDFTAQIANTEWWIDSNFYDTGDNSIYISDSTTGGILFNYHVTDEFGCSYLAPAPAFVAAEPIASFSTANECEGLNVVFNDLTTDPLNATISNWEWVFDDGDSAFVQNPGHEFPTLVGSYTVTLTAWNNAGCSDDTSVVVILKPSPTANFSYEDLCANESFAAFTDLSSIATGTISSWNWNFGNNTTSTDQNPNTNYSTPGIYPVELRVTGNNGCYDSIIYNLKVLDAPQASFTPLNDNACPPLCTSFNQTSIAPNDSIISWAWNFGDGSPIQYGENIDHCFSASSQVTLIITTQAGCSDTIKNTLTVHPIPSANFLPDPIVSNDIPADVSLLYLGSGATGFVYSLGDGRISLSPNAVVTYDEAGIYEITLTTTNSFGCENQSTETIYVQKIDEVPNVFTPNGDGLNDFFHLDAFGIQNYTISIYNRWGKRIFGPCGPTGDVMDCAWDGDNYSAGTYYYIITVDDIEGNPVESQNLRGYFSLIRD